MSRTFSTKMRIGGKLEGLGPMRLQAESLPDAVDRRGRIARHPRHGAQAPMRRALRPRLQGSTDRLGDRLITDLPRGAGAGLVQEPVDPLPGEALPPTADRVVIDAQPAGDRRVAQPFASQQDDARPHRQGLPGLLPTP
jgi:hypothetical protein